MTVATFVQPNYTTQSGVQYPSNIDAAVAVLHQSAGMYAPHEAATPNMTVVVDAGRFLIGTTLVANSQQTTGTITAPTTNPRIDRVVIDGTTGTVSVVTGAEAASPVPPAIPAGKLPIGQVLLQTSSTYINNFMLTDERAFMANFAPFANIASTGDVKLTFKSAADAGWVMMDDGSIGNASSGATTRANADTEPLFALLWNNISDTWAPVSGGRGASAAADFAANKTLTLPKALGRTLAVAGSGASLTTRALGENLGAETHTLTLGEIPAHSHTVATYDTATSPVGAQRATGSFQGNFNTGSAGGDGAHNNMQPTSFLNVMVKL